MSELLSVRAGENGPRHSGREMTKEFSRIDLEALLSLDVERQQDADALRRTLEVPSVSLSIAAKKEVEILVNMTIKDRARRSKVLPSSLFADPAWDMLLELYRAELRQHRISVTKLCAASQVPATTALRWTSTLEHSGLIARDADRLDGRRSYVRLTAAGSTAMTLYFSIDCDAEGTGVCEQ